MHEAITRLFLMSFTFTFTSSFRCLVLRNVYMCSRFECHMHSWHTNCKDPDGTAISGPALCTGIPFGVQGARNRWHWHHITPPCHRMRSTGPAEKGQFTHIARSSSRHRHSGFIHMGNNKVSSHLSSRLDSANWLKWQRSWLVFWKCPVQTSAREPLSWL
jgi:hypothetical protein